VYNSAKPILVRGGYVDSTRIKIRIGDHEFEAEGPPDMVQAQFEAFTELIKLQPISRTEPATSADKTEVISSPTPTVMPHVKLEKIMSVDGRVVSLTALPSSTEEAALLIMLGNKDMRNNLTVTGQEIGDGLAQSGQIVARVDRIMEKHIQDALVLKIGVGRGTRYRLTNQGLSRALSIAKDLSATLP
jgi:hypothetical protein